MSGRRNLSRSLTLLLMFVITIVVVLVIFAYFTGFFGLAGQSQKDVGVSGVFSIDNGGGPTGTLAFTLTNLSPTPMTGVVFSCPSSQFASPTCGGFNLDVDGVPLSAQNPVNDKGTANGATSVTSAPGTTFVVAQSYTVSLTVTFSDGATQAYSELLIAQA